MFKDIIFGLLLSFVYVVLVNKSISLFLSDLTYSEKFQQSMLIIFMIAILSLALAYTVFSSHELYKNNIIKIGLTVGGIWIMFHSLFINWNNINEEIKLLVIGVIFGLIIWFSYSHHNQQKLEKEKKLKDEKIKKKKEKREKERKRLEILKNIEKEKDDAYENASFGILSDKENNNDTMSQTSDFEFDFN